MIGGQALRPSDLPWLASIYEDFAHVPELWVMKASQVFVSEWLVNLALWCADTTYAGRGNAVYLLPTQVDADEFSQARVDTAIEQSDHLASRAVVRDRVGKAGVARVRLKRIGSGFVYLRGAEKRLLTIPGDVLCVDEVDAYRVGALEEARQRLRSSLAPLIRGGSTPSYPNTGIARLYSITTKRRYVLTCGACRHEQPLRFPENLTRDGRLVCAKCQGAMRADQVGRWEAEEPGATVEGLHVNRLYSPRADLVALATTGYGVLDGTVTEPGTVKEFWNQDLGRPHAPSGGAVTDDVLRSCIRPFPHEGPVVGQPVTMGVDVGPSALHVYIKCGVPTSGLNGHGSNGHGQNGHSQNGHAPADPDTGVVAAGTTRLLLATILPNHPPVSAMDTWPELQGLMRRYDVRVCVIDALPEEQRAVAFAQQFPGRVYRSFFPNMLQWKPESSSVWRDEDHVVLAHRTRSLDELFDRFYQQLEQLPRDAEYIPGLFAHLKAPVRKMVETMAGRQQVAVYDEGDQPDHHAFSALYAHMAWTVAHNRRFAVHPERPRQVIIGGGSRRRR